MRRLLNGVSQVGLDEIERLRAERDYLTDRVEGLEAIRKWNEASVVESIRVRGQAELHKGCPSWGTILEAERLIGKIQTAKARAGCKRLREQSEAFEDMYFGACTKWLEVKGERDSLKAAARALLDRLPICQCDQEMTEEPHFSDCCANEEVCGNEIKALEALL